MGLLNNNTAIVPIVIGATGLILYKTTEAIKEIHTHRFSSEDACCNHCEHHMQGAITEESPQVQGVNPVILRNPPQKYCLMTENNN